MGWRDLRLVGGKDAGWFGERDIGWEGKRIMGCVEGVGLGRGWCDAGY